MNFRGSLHTKIKMYLDRIVKFADYKAVSHRGLELSFLAGKMMGTN